MVLRVRRSGEGMLLRHELDVLATGLGFCYNGDRATCLRASPRAPARTLAKTGKERVEKLGAAVVPVACWSSPTVLTVPRYARHCALATDRRHLDMALRIVW
ncbi:hypothetical protein KC360_g144 [Hortaea werneckii]|nr:hypothetical protein KC360_g144 [Hortaea werneckii]